MRPLLVVIVEVVVVVKGQSGVERVCLCVGPSSTLCMVSGGVDGQVCRWLWNPDSHGAGSSTMAPRDQNGQRRSKAERR